MSARRYEHGFVRKALQLLHKIFAMAIKALYLHKNCKIDVSKELQVACVTLFEEFGKIWSLEFVKKYLTYYQSVKDIASAGKFDKISRSRFQYCNLVN